jgi:predicted nucleic acid-binding protein
MVLVDTSVWIRFFYGREPFLSEARNLLRRQEAAGHELVYGELLMGDRGGRKQFLQDYERMPQAKLVPHREVVALVRGRNLQGRGVGWIDVQLLASALAARLQIWTADPRFAAITEEFGIAYRI